MKKRFLPALLLCAAICLICAIASAVTVEGVVYNTDDPADVYVQAFIEGSVPDNLTIPADISGDPVVRITDGAFADCITVRKITVKGHLKSVGTDAFMNCTGLTKISFAGGVDKIGVEAFLQCSALTEFSTAKNLTSVGEEAFAGCSGLEKVALPGIKVLNEGVFLNCASLVSFSIPSTVTKIYDSAFSGCTGLKKMTIPNNVTDIGNAAFRYCTSLTSVVLPKNIDTIEDNTFSGCVNLKSVSIPDAVTDIGDTAFSDCTRLTIFCNLKSYAESYAKAKKIPVSYLATEITLDCSPDWDKGHEGTVTLTRTGSVHQPTCALKPSIEPDYAGDKTVSWKSSDETVATVGKDGVVTAKKPGTVTVTCKSNDGSGNYGVRATCKVVVKDAIMEKITLSTTSKTLVRTNSKPNPTLRLKATLTPLDPLTPALKWSTSDASVADVDTNGKVTAKGAGTATITCKATDGSNVRAKCVVTVMDTPVRTISLNKTAVTLTRTSDKKHPTFRLEATVYPNNALRQDVTWKSSDDTVASVDSNGKVTAKKAGTVTITCKSKDSSHASTTCKVTVKNKLVVSFKVVKKGKTDNLRGTTITLGKGKTLNLAVTSIKPANAVNQDIVFSSSDEKIAKISNLGVISARKKGTVTITVRSKDKGCRVTFTLIVR